MWIHSLFYCFCFIFAAPVIGEIGEQYCEVSWQAAKPFRGGDTIEYRLQLSDQSHTPSSNSEFKQVCPLSFFYAFLCYNSLLQLLLWSTRKVSRTSNICIRNNPVWVSLPGLYLESGFMNLLFFVKFRCTKEAPPHIAWQTCHQAVATLSEYVLLECAAAKLNRYTELIVQAPPTRQRTLLLLWKPRKQRFSLCSNPLLSARFRK